MTESQVLKKVTTLLTELQAGHVKNAAIIHEINDLLGGGAGIAGKVREFEERWSVLWDARYHTAYQFTRTRDIPGMKRLLTALGLDEVLRRATNYIRNDDPFYVRSRHPFGLFVSSINSHVGEPSPMEDFELAAPSGCRHTPPCKSDVDHTARSNADLRAVS